jgi:hypothetical protein
MFSAKGAALISSLGQRPKVFVQGETPALKSAIHFEIDLVVIHRASLNRAFRACSLSDQNPGAMPQAQMKMRLWRGR